MKKALLTFILGALILVPVLSQEVQTDRKGKFFLIPEFWLSFGTLTYIEVAPLVGYHVTDRLSVGLGPHYIYQNRKATPFNPLSFETHVYGLKSFARFALLRNAEQFLPVNLFSDLFLHGEYEAMSLERDIYGTTGPGDRFLYHATLVGAGLSQRVGLYNAVTFMVLWNLNESFTSPYSNPVFRVGFNTYF